MNSTPVSGAEPEPVQATAITPIVASSTLTISRSFGRSPRTMTEKSADTAGRVPMTTPASAAGKWARPEMSSVV